MKIIFIAICTFFSCVAFAQTDSTPTIKKILLAQFKTTHNVKDWFVPANDAIAGLSATQANWKDESENHSVAQLTEHLIFWNTHALNSFKRTDTTNFNGDNKETFSSVDAASWDAAVKKLDSVLTEWEIAITNADDQKLTKWCGADLTYEHA